MSLRFHPVFPARWLAPASVVSWWPQQRLPGVVGDGAAQAHTAPSFPTGKLWAPICPLILDLTPGSPRLPVGGLASSDPGEQVAFLPSPLGGVETVLVLLLCVTHTR